MGTRIKNARLALRLIPRPDAGPKIIERGGVVRPAPGVVINTVANRAQCTTEKGAAKALGADLPPPPHLSPGPRLFLPDAIWRNPFLRARVAWDRLIGGRA